jgi:hypothetical protein
MKPILSALLALTVFTALAFVGGNIEAFSAGSLRPEWMQSRHPERQLCL